jgi:hypothetical protein
VGRCWIGAGSKNPRRVVVVVVVVVNTGATNDEWLAGLVDEILPVHKGYEIRIIRKTANSYRRFGGLDKVPRLGRWAALS